MEEKRILMSLNAFAFIFSIVSGFVVSDSSIDSFDSTGIRITNVSCNWDSINITVTSLRTFKGMIFPKMSFYNPSCRYVTSDSGVKTMSIVLPLTECGNLIRDVDSVTHVLNDLVIQAHRMVETESDLVTSIVCTLPRLNSEEMDDYDPESNPIGYHVEGVNAWMDIEKEGDRIGIDVPNKLLVGDEIKLLITVKFDRIYKDLQLVNCWAHEEETILASQYALTLYDMYRCEGNDWISDLNVTIGSENVSLSTISGIIKTFKFPTSNNIYITCSVQLCRKACHRVCKDLKKKTPINYLKRSRRDIAVDSPDLSLRERHRLMKATIKALGAKLVEKNKRALLKNETSLRRRNGVPVTTSEESVSTENPKNSLINIGNSILHFNLSYNYVVYSSLEFNFRHEFDRISLNTAPEDCVPTLRFSIVTGSLSFALFCLVVSCLGFILYLRKENKRHRIDNFLLYNMR